MLDEEIYPVFEWEAIGYDRFRVQFSTVARFEEKYTITFPESNDAWLNEPSITLDKHQTNALKTLLGNKDGGPNNYLYWRIVA